MAINPINILVEKLAAILTDIARTKLERSEEVVLFLRRHGYENLEDDFEVLYVHTMVRRRQAKVPTAVLEIFRIPEVVKAFRKTWQAGEMLPFEHKIKWAIEAFASGDDVKGLDIDMLAEGRKFYDTFALLVSQARTPLQQENSRLLKDIHEATVNKLSAEDEKKLLEEFLKDVVVATSRIDIQGIYSMSGAGRKLIYFPIEQHYTPLKTMYGQAANERFIAGVSDGITSAEEYIVNEPDGIISAERIPLTRLLSSHKQLLIIGEPGGGKTTFLRFIACVFAKDILGQGEPGRKLHLGLSLEKPPLVPIWIRFSAVAGTLKKSRADFGETSLWRALSETMVELFGKAQATLLQKLLDDGRCALLLDGLDEEPNPNVRKQMVAVTDDVLHHWGKNLVVLSSRPFGYQAVSALKKVATAHIDAFGEEEILEFLNRWATALFPDDEERSRKAYLPELKSAVMNIPRIRRMAKNPVMLTCLCVVHWNEKKLPEGKADLLEAVLRWLLNAKEEKREARGYQNTFAEECFKSLALAMTEHPNGKQSHADLAWAAEQLENPFLDEMRVSGARLRRKGMDFLEAEMLDSGVVEQAGAGELRFWHSTFQDHYAAKALVELSDSDGPEGWWYSIATHLDDRQWDEVLEHFAGCLAMTGRRRLNLLVERILGTVKSGDLTLLARAVGVLGRLLRILEVYNYQPPERLGWQKARQQVMDIFTPKGASRVTVDQRVAVAEALGQAGDPRCDAFAPEMLPVSDIPDVLLGKYPVTVAEFQCFIQSGGYQDHDTWGKWWDIKEKNGWTEPAGWDEQIDRLNRPVTGVSWYEAAVYSRWLTGKTGMIFRLPMVVEWEKAAIHPKGCYPWGSDGPTPELLNFADNVGNPTPVGIYQAGAAPGGHLDMAGNVWEWCEDRYRKYRDRKVTSAKDIDVGADRVVRGGGWGSFAQECWSTIRDCIAPWHRDNDFGFRLARSVILNP